MVPALSQPIRAFSCGARWQQPDYKLVIYLIHSCDLERKANFSILCCSTAGRLDLLSVVFYWIFVPRIVQATFLWFEKRLACRLKKERFTGFLEKQFFKHYGSGLTWIAFNFLFCWHPEETMFTWKETSIFQPRFYYRMLSYSNNCAFFFWKILLGQNNNSTEAI